MFSAFNTFHKQHTVVSLSVWDWESKSMSNNMHTQMCSQTELLALLIKIVKVVDFPQTLQTIAKLTKMDSQNLFIALLNRY